MPNVLSSGTFTAATSEKILYESTSNFNYVLTFDCNNMILSCASSVASVPDELEIYARISALNSTASQRTVYPAAYKGPQSSPIKVSPPIAAPYGILIAVRQTLGGAMRTYDWNVSSLST